MAGLRKWLGGLFGGEGEPEPVSSLLNPRGADVRSFAGDNNDFALTLYTLLRKQPGNLFFSPFSIRTALAMTYIGARGETAKQMSAALCFSNENEMLHSDFSEVIQRLNEAGGGKYEMAIANSLWAQEGTPLQAAFLEQVVQHYASSVNLVDFRATAEAARVTINRWVEDKTRQKIQDLIPSGALHEYTRLVLVNAVYFKGKWVLQFSKTFTEEQPFHLETSGTVQVPLMHQQKSFRYLEGRGYQAIDLDYEGGDLSLLVLLPNRKDGLEKFEKEMSERKIHDCVANLDVCQVKLFLPRFKFTWGTVDVSQPLTALGMKLPFVRAQADFSGINGYQPPHDESLYIDGVFHKAFVEVNEEGTEAAAATAVTARASMAMYPKPEPPIPIFRADHPFLFAIRDRKSGAILFLGRMANPSQGT